jgi:hypothetical protein
MNYHAGCVAFDKRTVPGYPALAETGTCGGRFAERAPAPGGMYVCFGVAAIDFGLVPSRSIELECARRGPERRWKGAGCLW